MSGPFDDTGSIDFSSDDQQDTGREVDAETDVSAAAVAFNNAALPPDMPEWRKDAIRATAAAIIETLKDDEFRLVDARQREEEDQDVQAGMWQAAAARQREWNQSQVAIGSVTMSGKEWDDAYEFLSDPKTRDALIETMTRKKGWSKDRAEKAADDALTLAQIAQRKKDGTITAADMTKADEITRLNPDAVEMVKEAGRMKNDRGFETSYCDSRTKDATFADNGRSVTARASEIAAAPTDATFKNAPDLASRFDAARIASIEKAPGAPSPTAPATSPTLDLNATF